MLNIKQKNNHIPLRTRFPTAPFASIVFKDAKYVQHLVREKCTFLRQNTKRLTCSRVVLIMTSMK